MNGLETAAARYFEGGDFDGCASLFERCAAKTVFGHETLALCAAAFAETGRYGNALVLLKQAYKTGKKPEYLRDSGLIYLRSGRASAALRLFSRYLAKTPDDGTALYHAAAAAMNCNRLEQALVYTALALRTEDTPDLWFQAAEILDRTGRYAEALGAADRAAGLAPEFVGALRLAAKNCLETGDFAGALDRVRLALIAQKKNAGAPDAGLYFIYAKCFIALGRDREAAGVLEQTCRLEPDNLNVLRELFRAYVRLGDGEKTLSTGETILRLTDDGPTAAELAVLSYRTGDFGMANRMLRILLKNSAVSSEALKLVTVSFIKMNDFDQAIVYASKLLTGDDQDPEAEYLYAYTLAKLKRNEEAKDRLAQLVRKAPEDCPLRLEFARVLVALGDKERAYANLRYILDRERGSDDALYLFGQLAFETGDFATLAEYIRKYHSEKKTNDRSWFMLALTLEKMDETRAALAAANLAYKLTPRKPYLRKRIELASRLAQRG